MRSIDNVMTRKTGIEKHVPAIEFGSGALPPKIKAHLQRSVDARSGKPAAKTQYGSGIIHPKMRTHSGRAILARRAAPKIGFGAGAKVQFAQLDAGLAIDAADFVII